MQKSSSLRKKKWIQGFQGTGHLGTAKGQIGTRVRQRGDHTSQVRINWEEGVCF